MIIYSLTMTILTLTGLGIIVGLGAALPVAIGELFSMGRMKDALIDNADTPLLTHRRNDHDTSIAAATQIEGRISKLMRGVYNVLAQHPEGLNDSELRAAMHLAGFPECPEGTYRKRRTDLASLGYVYFTGERRKNQHNSPQKVWAVVPGKPLPEKGAQKVLT